MAEKEKLVSVSDFVPIKGALKQQQKIAQTNKELDTFLKETYGVEYIKLKDEPELHEYIFRVVHFLVKDKYDIDRKEFTIKFFKEKFGASEADIKVIERNIEYFISNKIIKKIPRWRKDGMKVLKYFKKRIL